MKLGEISTTGGDCRKALKLDTGYWLQKNQVTMQHTQTHNYINPYNEYQITYYILFDICEIQAILPDVQGILLHGKNLQNYKERALHKWRNSNKRFLSPLL